MRIEIDSEGLRRGLARLPERTRQAVEMRYFAGLTYREIGGEVGVTCQGARAVVMGGLRRLRSAEIVRVMTGEAEELRRVGLKLWRRSQGEVVREVRRTRAPATPPWWRGGDDVH